MGMLVCWYVGMLVCSGGFYQFTDLLEPDMSWALTERQNLSVDSKLFSSEFYAIKKRKPYFGLFKIFNSVTSIWLLLFRLLNLRFC